MTVATQPLSALYKPRRGRVELVDVPELSYLVVPGQGAPEGFDFAAAIQALYAVSWGAHFLSRKAFGEAPAVMPLEALWWVEGERQQGIVEEVARGGATMADTDRGEWRWEAMIVQGDPIDAVVVAEAVAQARGKNLTALDRIELRTWTEGRCAQLLHVGPYAEEAPSLARLHTAIADGGLRPRGRHHEIYLGDPRRAAPQRLRTILRQPVEPA
ncbi:GyrI-like domain-containing protein [Phycicoccus sp. Soil748]|uniref:GyrI-like domain-containing protein n=1 Tax=Phycicoccus sp. Soil748 TaxID=1736397 RepID=UPI00070331D5|nr:GyrI-like domain-containing protein [Phycicoccus sp. Soil748]KRE52530.1 hypothetical protein ASG70_14115 [Phycicoccus sp. Soil748]